MRPGPHEPHVHSPVPVVAPSAALAHHRPSTQPRPARQVGRQGRPCRGRELCYSGYRQGERHTHAFARSHARLEVAPPASCARLARLTRTSSRCCAPDGALLCEHHAPHQARGVICAACAPRCPAQTLGGPARPKGAAVLCNTPDTAGDGWAVVQPRRGRAPRPAMASLLFAALTAVPGACPPPTCRSASVTSSDKLDTRTEFSSRRFCMESPSLIIVPLLLRRLGGT
jgi:hypothetical protein